MHKIKLDPLPIVTGDPDELLDLDICDTCEFATTQAARIAAICAPFFSSRAALAASYMLCTSFVAATASAFAISAVSASKPFFT